MQPRAKVNSTIMRVARKEVSLFFASPIAYIFLATFSAISLFVFFWGESFFSRNISDVRPLFEWMPVLLIFLSGTITMRLWSEERRSGTLEHVLTQAIPLWHFVLGKFLGCLFLLAIALLITLPLPFTVSFIGYLDWGPVISAYIATLLLGAAYLSIGLFISAKSDNQIVSLISTSVVAGIFYLLGSTTVTSLFGNQGGELLRLLGTGSRFDSITRGVIDLRDLYYYGSIILVFLALNTYVLEKERWAKTSQRPQHKQWRVVTLLVVANALIGNVWLTQLHGLRIDVTEGNQYSLSAATKNYLQQLQEPLLIRGYFSGKTHPLLAPLVPQMRDLIKEYEVAGHGRVRTEFVDPMESPELEEEAGQKYNIRPVPFQVADRYQSSIVSSYFNVLVEYGDQHEVLSFQDLIEVRAKSEAEVDVQLRNPEHDLTRLVKKVLNSYQAGGNLFDTVQGSLTFQAYISADEKLPQELLPFKKTMLEVLDEFKHQANDRLEVKVSDPAAGDGQLIHKIAQDYGFTPMVTGLLDSKQFYYYMILSRGDRVVQIPLSGVDKAEFKKSLEAGIKRFAKGFTKTVALVTPKPDEAPAHGHGRPQPQAQFTQLQRFLGAEHQVVTEALEDGAVSSEADILLLAAPKNLSEVEVFAVDQFLMQGGTVIATTSPYSAAFAGRGLGIKKHFSGIVSWLSHKGISIDDELVLDPQNSALPIPVPRTVGGFQIQEMRMLDYPYFIDVRPDGLNEDSIMTSELPQLTVPWASPLRIAQENNSERVVTELFHSTANSWRSSSMDILPKMDEHGLSAFTATGDTQSELLGVSIQGGFDSYFAGKKSPLLPTSKPEDNPSDEAVERLTLGRIIERSPESSRIIVLSSNDLLRDEVLQVVGGAQQTEYLNSLQLIANAIDWSLEDSGLLSIRSRGHFNRTLPPMEKDRQLFWEYFNYILAALALIVVAIVERRARYQKQRQYLSILAS